MSHHLSSPSATILEDFLLAFFFLYPETGKTVIILTLQF